MKLAVILTTLFAILCLGPSILWLFAGPVAAYFGMAAPSWWVCFCAFVVSGCLFRTPQTKTSD